MQSNFSPRASHTLAASAAGNLPPIEIRRLESGTDFAQCLALQQETWGHDFRELVPAALLKITQEVGGVAAGAFDTDGAMLGFVYGVSGFRDGEPAHWSHMLAVRRDRRGHGIGRRLKLYQREVLLELGVTAAYWTYDPLVARNGHLNINRLGARIVQYVRNMYGESPMSSSDTAFGTDRLIVRWDLAQPEPERAPPSGWERAPLVTLGSAPTTAKAIPSRAALPGAAMVRIEVPADIETVRGETPDAAETWRLTTRRAFEHYLGQAYRVAALVRGDRGNAIYYVLQRP